jgi:hypothetical protein
MSPTSDFDSSLPVGKEYFSMGYLARLWQCSEDNVQRLIDAGDLAVAIDVAPIKSVKAMQRITRASVVAFLNSRKSGVFQRARKKVK